MAILQNIRLPLILFAAIGSALSAGVFFAFSTFVAGTSPPTTSTRDCDHAIY